MQTLKKNADTALWSVPAKLGNINQISLLYLLDRPDLPPTETTFLRLFPSNTFSLIHCKIIESLY